MIRFRKHFLDFSHNTKYKAVQTVLLHYIFTQTLSDGIWVRVIVLFKSRWKKVHFKEMIRIFGGSRKQPWGAPLVRKSADLQQIEAKTISHVHSCCWFFSPHLKISSGHIVASTLSPTPLRENRCSLTTAKATETWRLCASRQINRWRQNLEPKPCCKRDVSRAKIAAGDNVAGDAPSACLPAAAAAALNNSCGRRRNIASGSHRHADPCRRWGKHCTCTHANTSIHFMEIAALPLEWNCFFGRKWKPSETSCRHYFSNKK